MSIGSRDICARPGLPRGALAATSVLGLVYPGALSRPINRANAPRATSVLVSSPRGAPAPTPRRTRSSVGRRRCSSPLPRRFRADAEADAIEGRAATVLVSSTRALPRRRRGGRGRRSREPPSTEELAVCEAPGDLLLRRSRCESPRCVARPRCSSPLPGRFRADAEADEIEGRVRLRAPRGLRCAKHRGDLLLRRSRRESPRCVARPRCSSPLPGRFRADA